MTHTEKRVHSWFFSQGGSWNLMQAMLGHFITQAFMHVLGTTWSPEVIWLWSFKMLVFQKKMWDFFWNVFRNISGTFCGSWFSSDVFWDISSDVFWDIFLDLFLEIFHELFHGIFQDTFLIFSETFSEAFLRLFLRLWIFLRLRVSVDHIYPQCPVTL